MEVMVGGDIVVGGEMVERDSPKAMIPRIEVSVLEKRW